MSGLAGMAVFIGFSQAKQLTCHSPIKMRTLTVGNGLSMMQNGGIYGGIYGTCQSSKFGGIYGGIL